MGESRSLARPAGGLLGDTKRNMLYGPGVENFDMSVDKNFNMPYNEHHQFQIRLDAFNALNHTISGYRTPIGNPRRVARSPARRLRPVNCN